MHPISSHVEQLTHVMNASELRHRVISHNLANINTPGYQRLEVEFEEAYREQIRSGHAEAGTPSMNIVEEAGLSVRADGNNVDVDREVGEMNRNTVLFQTCSQILASQFDMMRRALRGA